MLFLVDQESRSVFEMHLNDTMHLARIHYGLSSQVRATRQQVRATQQQVFNKQVTSIATACYAKSFISTQVGS